MSVVILNGCIISFSVTFIICFPVLVLCFIRFYDFLHALSLSFYSLLSHSCLLHTLLPSVFFSRSLPSSLSLWFSLCLLFKLLLCPSEDSHSGIPKTCGSRMEPSLVPLCKSILTYCWVTLILNREREGGPGRERKQVCRVVREFIPNPAQEEM